MASLGRGEIRDLSWQQSRNKATKSWIKPDRPKTRKARNLDQVREKRHRNLLPHKTPPQVMNILPAFICAYLSVYSDFHKLSYLHCSTVVSGLGFFLVMRPRVYGDILETGCGEVSGPWERPNPSSSSVSGQRGRTTREPEPEASLFITEYWK